MTFNFVHVLCFSDLYSFFFFFQAEDGIRDDLVTGVQTCALPIYRFPPDEPHGSEGNRCIDCARSETATASAGGRRRTCRASDRPGTAHPARHPRRPTPIQSCGNSNGAGWAGGG